MSNEGNTEDKGTLDLLDDEISDVLTKHGDEIRAIADAADGDDDLSEKLDDIANDAKGHYGAKAANEQTDADAETAIEVVENWIAGEVVNSTADRRVALAYVMLGRTEARQRLGQDPARRFRVVVDEIQHHRRIYTIDAESEAEAIEKAEIGDTVSEEEVRFVGVVSRDNAEIVTD